MPIGAIMTLLLVMTAPAAGQVSACGTDSLRPVRIAHGFAVNPLAAFERGGEVTVLGWPAYHVTRQRTTADRSIDSTLVGVVLRGDRAPRSIPRPMADRPFEEPYVIRLLPEGAEILFHVPHERPVPTQRPDSIEIWVGLLAGGTWKRLTHLLTVDGRPALGTQLVAALRQTPTEAEYAFGARDATTRVEGLWSLTQRDGQWVHTRDTTSMHGVDYVDVAPIRGRWWRALIGPPLGSSWRDHTLPSELVISSLGPDGWGPHVSVAREEDQPLFEPRLIDGDSALFVAWLQPGDSGRVVRLSAVTAAGVRFVETRPVVGRLTPGTAPWREVLGIAIHADTGILATPTLQGWRERVRLPISLGVPPLLFSTARGPHAVTLAPDPRDGDIEVLHFFDLRCALGGPRPFP